MIPNDLYNKENANIDDKLYYLSSLDKPTVSFFSDLKLTSIDDLDKYDKIDKDILLLKKALIDLDEQILKSLSLDNSFTFNEIAKIYLLGFKPICSPIATISDNSFAASSTGPG